MKEIPKHLEAVSIQKMNLEGVDNLLIGIAFLVDLFNKFKLYYEDKNISWNEAFGLGYFLFTRTKAFFTALPLMLKEAIDKITEDEVAQLTAALNKSEYIQVIATPEMVKDSIDLLARIKNYIFKHFVTIDAGAPSV